VVNKLNVHQLTALIDLLFQRDVYIRRIQVTGGVIVIEDYATIYRLQRNSKYQAGVSHGTGETATGNLVRTLRLIRLIEEQDNELHPKFN
jgi:hypothetical protein